MDGTEIVVIGAGVIGGAIAHHLARDGARVTIAEAREVACAASGASAGGVRQQGRDPRELPLALRAIGRWPHLADELGADLGYHQGGHLILAESADALAALGAAVARQRAGGLDVRLIDADEVRALASAVAPSILGGAYCPSDGHANPIATTLAFVRAAQRLGARLLTQTRVTAIAAEGGRVAGVVTDRGRIACDVVVVAAGGWAAEVAGLAGVRVPVRPAALQMIVTAPARPALKPVLGCAGRQLSLKQLAGGQYLIGGGWPGRLALGDGCCPNLAPSLAGSARTATAIWPPLRGLPVVRARAGLEGRAADEVPILDLLDTPAGLALACGFSGHGFALAPAVGEALTALIAGRQPPAAIAGLRLGRFSSHPPRLRSGRRGPGVRGEPPYNGSGRNGAAGR